MTTRFEGQGPSNDRDEIWFESSGVRLYAVKLGRGSAIVFLHGGLADHRAALLRVRSLATSHCLIVPDLRGSGRSIYTGELSWDCLADDIAALLDHLGLERAVVGGTSMGSGVALRFALRHPRRVTGVVLVTPVYPGADRELAQASRTAMTTMAEVAQRALDQGLEAFRPLFDRLPIPIRSAAIEMMLGFDAASVAATARFLASDSQPIENVRQLTSMDVPVMIVPGTDAEHPSEVAALYAEHLRYPTIVDPASPDLLEQIRRFSDETSGVGRP